MASSAFTLTGAAGSLLKFAATTGGPIEATVDSLTDVDSVAWSIHSTDETSVAATIEASFTIGGSKGSIVTFTGGSAGTCAILQCRINHGVNILTGNVDESITTERAKVYVNTGGGYEVCAYDEEGESNAVAGWVEPLNEFVRCASKTTFDATSWQKDDADVAAATATDERPIFTAPASLTVTAIRFSPAAALTANDTNFATSTVRRRDGAGGAANKLGEYESTLAGGSLVAFVSKSIAVDSSFTAMTAGQILTFAITKTAAGVVWPAGLLTIHYTLA